MIYINRLFWLSNQILGFRIRVQFTRYPADPIRIISYSLYEQPRIHKPIVIEAPAYRCYLAWGVWCYLAFRVRGLYGLREKGGGAAWGTRHRREAAGYKRGVYYEDARAQYDGQRQIDWEQQHSEGSSASCQRLYSRDEPSPETQDRKSSREASDHEEQDYREWGKSSNCKWW